MAYHIASNQLTPEIKKLNDQLEKLEESLEGTDECVVDIYRLEERLEDKLVYLQEDLTSVREENTELKDHLKSVIKELNAITDGGIEDKLIRLEEGLMSVKGENIELKNHLNSVIKELNGITSLLNEKNLIEKTYELTI